MARRFNPAPGWPPPPEGWKPQPDWQPDPSWPPAPPGWQLWVEDSTGPAGWVKRHKVWTSVLAVLALLIAAGAAGGGGDNENSPTVAIGSPSPEATTPTPVPKATTTPTLTPSPHVAVTQTPRSTVIKPGPGSALALLETLPVKGRAPKTGYSRETFGQAWADTDRNGCDTRNDILRRDLTGAAIKPGTNGCVVLSGKLADPYTAQIISFVRGGASEVDIDHVVSLSDAWQTGAFAWPTRKRLAFANDPLNLLAVDASANRQKGDSDAASWLPPNKPYRCAYIARQVAAKARYQLWLAPAEHDAMRRILMTCPRLAGPTGTAATLAPIAPSQQTTTTATPKPTTTTATPKPTTTAVAPKPATTTAAARPTKQSVSYAVHPGAFCSEHASYGYSAKGVLYQCKTKPGDPAYRWRRP
jgi:hypothetical protein